jgi:uncharacterized coiled-coil DUF342 family protein
MGHQAGPREANVERAKQMMEAWIDQSVQDPGRATQVKGLMGEVVSEVNQLAQKDRDYHRKLYELSGNYEATPEEFTKILDEMNNNRMRSASRVLAIRFKVKALLTAQEWKALSDEMAKYRGRYGRHPDTSQER